MRGHVASAVTSANVTSDETMGSCCLGGHISKYATSGATTGRYVRAKATRDGESFVFRMPEDGSAAHSLRSRSNATRTIFAHTDGVSFSDVCCASVIANVIARSRSFADIAPASTALSIAAGTFIGAARCMGIASSDRSDMFSGIQAVA